MALELTWDWNGPQGAVPALFEDAGLGTDKPRDITESAEALRPATDRKDARRDTHAEADLAALLLATGRGDARAFDALYRATSANLMAIALRVLRRETLAEEVLQDAFVSIWRNAARFDLRVAAPYTWMVSIVRNRALDVVRHARFEGGLPGNPIDEAEFFDTLISETPTPIDAWELRSDAARLKRALATLGTQQRQALVLAYFDDKSHAEVAEAMAIPLGTAKSWIRRGLIELRVHLAEAEAA